MSEGGVTAVEEALRLHPTWINGGGDIPGPGGAVDRRHAGRVQRAVSPRPLLPHGVGVDLRHPRPPAAGGGRASGAQQWRAPFGALSAANWIAVNANQYLHRYGATREMLGLIAVNGRQNAARNPAAIYRQPMTMDDYMTARPITTPFGLYDCDVPCDGSIAVVVSDASAAGDLPQTAVRVEAVGTQILERISWDQGTVTHEPQVLGQAAHLWTRTDLRPTRRGPRPRLRRLHVQRRLVDRSPRVLRPRRGPGLARRRTEDRAGRRAPVNPHGGQLSEGRTHGFGFIYEAVKQLRHAAGDRQVADPTTAVVTTGGGTPSGVLLLQRDRA